MFVTGMLVLAAIRWFHMCRPYDRHRDYYYPGRPYLTLYLLLSISLIPCVFDPLNADCWYLRRFYFLPMYAYGVTLILLGYFANVMERRHWIWPMIGLGIPIVLILLIFYVLAIIPGEQIATPQLAFWADFVVILLGGASTSACLYSLWKVREWSRRFDVDDYSNPMDFPVQFAQRVIGLAITTLCILWIGAMVNNRPFLCFVQILMLIVSVLLVIYTLHPKRSRQFDDLDSGTAGFGQNKPIPARTSKAILTAIRKVVETDKGFLESHLTLNDVATRTGYNRTYVAAIIKREYGGFFNYVNSLRLDYADEYKIQHPGASISELVAESGFGSRQTYYNIKDRLGR